MSENRLPDLYVARNGTVLLNGERLPGAQLVEVQHHETSTGTWDGPNNARVALMLVPFDSLTIDNGGDR